MPDRLDLSRAEVRVAVIVPCHDEALTIGPLVAAIHAAMPWARVVVIDNASTDGTAAKALNAGAEVMKVARRGKGNAVRWAFDHVDADVYVLMDGDGTYDPAEAPFLIHQLIAGNLDMVVGARRDVTRDAGRRGHATGNRIFNQLFSRMFGAEFSDIFSGYRAFSRRYVKSFPALSSGFEIETEMSVHAQMLRLGVEEVPVSYGRRPPGSESKLSTWRDGFRILRTFLLLAKVAKPFSFFTSLSLAALALSMALGIPVVLDFLRTGLVERQPTWLLSVALAIISVNMFFSGVILHSLARGQLEQKMLILRSIPNFSPSLPRLRAELPAPEAQGEGLLPLAARRAG